MCSWLWDSGPAVGLPDRVPGVADAGGGRVWPSGMAIAIPLVLYFQANPIVLDRARPMVHGPGDVRLRAGQMTWKLKPLNPIGSVITIFGVAVLAALLPGDQGQSRAARRRAAEHLAQCSILRFAWRNVWRQRPANGRDRHRRLHRDRGRRAPHHGHLLRHGGADGRDGHRDRARATCRSTPAASTQNPDLAVRLTDGGRGGASGRWPGTTSVRAWARRVRGEGLDPVLAASSRPACG